MLYLQAFVCLKTSVDLIVLVDQSFRERQKRIGLFKHPGNIT